MNQRGFKLSTKDQLTLLLYILNSKDYKQKKQFVGLQIQCYNDEVVLVHSSVETINKAKQHFTALLNNHVSIFLSTSNNLETFGPLAEFRQENPDAVVKVYPKSVLLGLHTKELLALGFKKLCKKLAKKLEENNYMLVVSKNEAKEVERISTSKIQNRARPEEEVQTDGYTNSLNNSSRTKTVKPITKHKPKKEKPSDQEQQQHGRQQEQEADWRKQEQQLKPLPKKNKAPLLLPAVPKLMNIKKNSDKPVQQPEAEQQTAVPVAKEQVKKPAQKKRLVQALQQSEQQQQRVERSIKTKQSKNIRNFNAVDF